MDDITGFRGGLILKIRWSTGFRTVQKPVRNSQITKPVRKLLYGITI
jgi:hypothetical protein